MKSKSICISVLLFHILLVGCGSIDSISTTNSNVKIINTKSEVNDNSEVSEISSMPDRITLSFNPLHLNEPLKVIETPSEWKYIKSIPFGRIENSDAILDIYELIDSGENLVNQINGVLNFKDNQLLISDLSSSLIENDEYICQQVCLFQRFVSNQNRFELIGSIDVSLNGPGLKTYIIYDVTNKKVMSIDLWGEPSFIDLDDDGNDEFIIEFQGLHLSWPDLSIIRTVNGQMEISTSVFSSLQKKQGDFATLNKDRKPLIISISNVQSENEPVYNFTYKEGILVRRE